MPVYIMQDNVFDGTSTNSDGSGAISLQKGCVNSQFNNNLLINTATYNLYYGWDSGLFGGSAVLQASLWDNILVSGNQSGLWALSTTSPYCQSGSQAPLAYMDYNVYDAPSHYRFQNDSPMYTLAQIQGQGFETHTSVSADSGIFQDMVSYTVLPQWQTSGRYGDTIGPRFAVSQILDPSRYGPGTLGTASAPLITQQPQDQTVAAGGAATFTLQVQGSSLFYQWQRSNDGGSSWISIQDTNSPSFSISSVASGDNGAIFRCLVSSAGGSAWSRAATLTVNAMAPAMAQPLNSTMTGSSMPIQSLGGNSAALATANPTIQMDSASSTQAIGVFDPSSDNLPPSLAGSRARPRFRNPSYLSWP
jgi:hypothetical protein